jgi:hypothetical protein
MLTTTGRDALLTSITGVVTHVGLIQSIADWRAGTVTAANYTSYARAAITWGAAGDTTPAGGRKRANSGAVTFPKNTGTDQAVIAYGLYTDVSAGTLQAIGLLDTDQPIAGTCLASSDLITAYAHGLVTDQRVFMLASPFGPPPDVFAENTAYFVLAAGLTADVFALSATSAGAAINASTSGVAMWVPYKSQTIASNAVAEFAIGQIVVEL